MSETHINAYKAELVKAEVELDQAKGRVQALKDYIESVEPSKKKSKASESKKSEAQEVIKTTDTENQTRPVVEDSVADVKTAQTTRKQRKGKK